MYIYRIKPPPPPPPTYGDRRIHNRAEGGFGVLPGKLLTRYVQLTGTPKGEGAQRRNSLPGVLCETPSVDSTVVSKAHTSVHRSPQYCDRGHLASFLGHCLPPTRLNRA